MSASFRIAAFAALLFAGTATAQVTAPPLSQSREMPAAPEPFNKARDMPLVHSIGVPNLEEARVREKLAGYVLLQVTIAPSGIPSEVLILDEAPKDGGFGEKARARMLEKRFPKAAEPYLRVLTSSFPTVEPLGAEDLRRQKKAAGAAIVEVMADFDGTIQTVRLVDEAPAGKGFGEAAVAQVRTTRMPGSDYGGTRTLSLFFPEKPPAPRPSAKTPPPAQP